MEELIMKYLSACQGASCPPSESILHTLRAGAKSGEPFGDEGLVSILDFSGSSLSVGDCSLLAKCFASDTFVEGLRFTDCLLCEDACCSLINALIVNKRMKKLDFKGNNLRNSGAQLMGKLLKRTSTLVELNLEWNSLGMWDEGLTAIAEGISVNQTLKSLNLSNNQISHDGGTELAHAFKQNRSLRTVDLRWNNIGVLGGRALAAAVQHNKCIVKLHIDGNNIPSDTMKAIASAVQRNIDCQSIYDEHRTVTSSLRQEIKVLEQEKSLQVTTLLDQLDREKQLHESLVETSRDRLEQMRVVLEERKSELALLKSKCESSENAAAAAGRQVEDLSLDLKKQKELNSVEQERFDGLVRDLKSRHKADEIEWEQVVRGKANRIAELEESHLELKVKCDAISKTCANLESDLTRQREASNMKLVDAETRIVKERDAMQARFDEQASVLSEKLKRIEAERYKLEEEVSRLKAAALNEKLHADEELINLRAKLKQEEQLKCRQYEERIDLLLATKDELQAKSSKLGIQLSEAQTQLTSFQRDSDLLTRQIDQQRQQLDQRDAEYRNEMNRARIELDSEKRVQSELREKLTALERLNQELHSKHKETLSSKDSEILRLQDLVRNKEADMDRIRDEELRRAGMLETAMHSYILSARTSRK